MFSFGMLNIIFYIKQNFSFRLSLNDRNNTKTKLSIKLHSFVNASNIHCNANNASELFQVLSCLINVV